MRQSNSKGGAAPVPGYKRSKWLPGIFQAAQLSAQGKDAVCGGEWGMAGGGGYFWRFACIYYLPCGKNSAESFQGEIVPSVLICAEASAQDWCRSLLKWRMELCCCRRRTAQQRRPEKEKRLKRDFNAAFRNQCGVWLQTGSKTRRSCCRLSANSSVEIVVIPPHCCCC